LKDSSGNLFEATRLNPFLNIGERGATFIIKAEEKEDRICYTPIPLEPRQSGRALHDIRGIARDNRGIIYK